MKIDRLYKRVIRIECNTQEPVGTRTIVKDVKTQEEITNISRITIVLAAGECNIAQVTYVDEANGETGTSNLEYEYLDIPAMEV